MSNTRDELQKQALKLRAMNPQSNAAQALSNQLVQAIEEYTAEHPFDTDEMGILAGDTDEDPTHKICLTRADMNALVEAARANKRVALMGKPGFGRVFAAQELAYILIGREIPDHVVLAQFNEDYTFADFLGVQPAVENFLRNDGLFYRLCQAAAKSDLPYVMVINETWPGKVDEIFRQLDELLSDSTGQAALQALYGTEQPFSVPENVYIYALTAVTGTNALAPHSFTARPLKASMELNELIQEAEAATDLEELREALNMVEGINMVVTKGHTLGPEYSIRQNFVCPCTLRSGDDVLAFVVERDLNPLITEYCKQWTDDWARLRAQRAASAG